MSNKNFNSQIISQGTLIKIDEQSTASKKTILRTQVNVDSKDTFTPTNVSHIKSNMKTKPKVKRLESARIYKNADEISRDSYSDVELSPKSNDPKNMVIKLE